MKPTLWFCDASLWQVVQKNKTKPKLIHMYAQTYAPLICIDLKKYIKNAYSSIMGIEQQVNRFFTVYWSHFVSTGWLNTSICFVVAERVQAGAGWRPPRWTTRPPSAQTRPNCPECDSTELQVKARPNHRCLPLREKERHQWPEKAVFSSPD